MKVGDLVRFKHFKDEIGLVVVVHEGAHEKCWRVDVRRVDGAMMVHRDPTAFEVIHESR